MSRTMVGMILASLLFWPIAAQAGYGPYLDPSAFGQQAKAKINDDGKIEVEKVQSVPVWETIVKEQQVSKDVEVDGEKKEETKTVQVPVLTTRMVSQSMTLIFATDSVEAYDMTGKRVTADQITKALQEPTTVLLASRKVPRYFLTIYKPDTLLLVMSPASVGGQPPPAGVPLPAAPRAVPAPVDPGATPAAPAPRAVPVPAVPDPATPRAIPGLKVPVIQAGGESFGPEPLVSMAKGTDEGITIRRYLKELSNETGVREVTEGKTTKKVEVKIEVESIIDVERKYPQNALEFYRASGEEVKVEDLKDVLASDTTVLVSADGKKVDERWLKIVKPETLIILAPQAATTVNTPVVVPEVAAPPGVKTPLVPTVPNPTPIKPTKPLPVKPVEEGKKVDDK